MLNAETLNNEWILLNCAWAYTNVSPYEGHNHYMVKKLSILIQILNFTHICS